MIEFRIKEKTRSLNESFRGDWRPRAGAAKRQRTKAMQACPTWPGGPLLHVRLTRVSKGTLDFQNLAGALKHAQDGVASRLKVDDASPLVEWHYAQAKGEAEVVVQIWKTGEDAPPVPEGRPVERKGKKRNAVIGAAPRSVRLDVSGYNPDARLDWRKGERLPRAAYTPPRSKPVAAAREAETTFAPAPRTCACGPTETCQECCA